MGARLGIKKPLVPGGSRGARAGTGLVSSLRASQVRECGSASRLHPHPQAGLSSNYHDCCLTIRDSCPDNLPTQAKINTKIIQNGPLLRLAARHCRLSVGVRERGRWRNSQPGCESPCQSFLGSLTIRLPKVTERTYRLTRWRARRPVVHCGRKAARPPVTTGVHCMSAEPFSTSIPFKMSKKLTPAMS